MPKCHSRRILLTLVSVLSFISYSLGQDKKPVPTQRDTSKTVQLTAPATPQRGPKPYKDVITDKAITKKGLVWVHKMEEKWFFEIADSLLNRDILLVNRIAKAPANTRSGFFGFAGDGAFGISINEMTSICREQWPAITMVIFRNYQWGAEKRNSILWYDNNFVGTELDPKLSYAKIAEACGFKGVTVRTQSETTAALKKAAEDQAKGVTTFIEVILNQELGEPFRRDAMKKPVAVAHINKADMRPQKGSA